MTPYEQECISRLYLRYRERLLEFVKAQIDDPDAAEELVHDGFEDMIREADCLRGCPERTRVKKLYSLVQKRVNKWQKKRAKTQQQEFREEENFREDWPGAARNYEQMIADRSALEWMMTNLYGDDRILAEYLYVEELKPAEIAGRMNITVETYYKKKSRACEKMRWLSRHGQFPLY